VKCNLSLWVNIPIVGIATRCGLDGLGVESRWVRDFPHPSRPYAGTHPAFYTMGIGSFPRIKRPGRCVNHLPPSRPEVKERTELHIYSPSGPSWRVLGWYLHPKRFSLRFTEYSFCIFTHFSRGWIQNRWAKRQAT